MEKTSTLNKQPTRKQQEKKNQHLINIPRRILTIDLNSHLLEEESWKLDKELILDLTHKRISYRTLINNVVFPQK